MGQTLKVPHTLVLLLGMMVVALLATWVVPQGFFETSVTESGRQIVVAGTYQLVEQKQYLTPWDLLTAIPKAFAQAQDVIFFVLIVGGVLSIARATGTVDALIGRLLEKHGTKPQRLIFMVVFCFALASSTIGTAGEYIPFVLILVALCKAMRLDAMTAVGMIVAGYGIGYGVSAFNPFTVLIAQQIADIPVYSGIELRLAIFIPFVLIGFHHVWSYAKKVSNDPSKSMMIGVPCPLEGQAKPNYPKLNSRHQAVLFSFIITLCIAVWGIATKGWYLYELGGLFVAWGVVIAVIGKLSADETAERFIEGVSDLVTTAVLIGVARGIALILEDGQILHTLVYSLSSPLSHVAAEISAVGMLVIQTFLNTFIPSGSGQAYVTMPLMVPVGDLVGVPRQVAVLAYQFGDGFSNMIIPTNAVLMGILGMAGVPYTHWFRFCLPLIGKLLLAASVVLVLAVSFGYGLDVQPIIE
ncbi:YfcC family protein [Pseudoalteromonas luteoviolacea]|uniref:Short-chain fatty acid transporter n=1 Tax=Pseudoalteromonas luteoviolacea S4054 TaxID=1129367 RepID=A0A0F6ADH8_9GAMM|nr:TIGR00366 family protein [Pseudoalteromonas luteoviolacea]AOT08287.1 short-chain fatty acid transporter [Pseudoalteromonas luteoviolacea]AOT13203.1 short-chain fatty acid transporter [Pseudoalteromonas luteoviolacea]AOT18116.1 short-chain fatty acid transporter [Pseudoalteromonas luteoviolacea]KKE84223.1 short-chain fatty acid transporter [Pseudoalteromonas luteoviolacea S4054]KZN76172.1 short-chain fatty acid transporter [Pseudoalteromonas luteoviolacea S4047-1]